MDDISNLTRASFYTAYMVMAQARRISTLIMEPLQPTQPNSLPRTMSSTKRDLLPDIETSSPKRVRISYAEDDDGPAAMMTSTSTSTTTSYERPRNHPIYGQKSAFPGLDTATNDELFYGPADDGMEYLRMVR